MIEFCFNSRSLALFPYKLPIWVSFCPYGVSFCPEYHPQPLFFTQPSRTQKTPTPPQNTPFPVLILKVGKMNSQLGKMDPNWAKCLKSGRNFSSSGQKKNIHNNVLPSPSMQQDIHNNSQILLMQLLHCLTQEARVHQEINVWRRMYDR